MKLSPSQTAVLACLKKGGIRYLPKGAVIKDYPEETIYHTLGCKWAWSWELNQQAFTADYRRRIHELKEKHKYKIISFEVSENGVRRHGYILVTELMEEKRSAP